MMRQADFKKLNVKPDDFNEYSIRAIGKKVTIKVNGIVSVDEEFPILPDEGVIALQYAGFTTEEATFKNIEFRNLAAKSADVAGNRSRETKSAVTSLAAIPESSHLLFACQDDPTLYGINEAGAAVELGRHDGPIRTIGVSPDGSKAVTGGDDGGVQIWSLAAARPRDALTGPEGKYLKASDFVGAYAVLRYQDGLMVFDETNNKKEVIQIGKPGHRVLLGFKHFCNRNQNSLNALGRRCGTRYGPSASR